MTVSAYLTSCIVGGPKFLGMPLPVFVIKRKHHAIPFFKLIKDEYLSKMEKSCSIVIRFMQRFVSNAQSEIRT